MFAWWRRWREARAVERDEAVRMLDLFGFEEAFHMLVSAKVRANRREDWPGDAHFTRLRWALFREEKRRRKIADAMVRDVLARRPAASGAQLLPDRADLLPDGALVGPVSGL